MRWRTLESVLLHTQHRGRGMRGRKGGQIDLLLRPAWQGPRCRRRPQERKEEEEEERDNEAEDPGERTVAHSTHGERKEREEGRTLRLAAPLDCCYPRNANTLSTTLKTMRRQEPRIAPFPGFPFSLTDARWIEVGASHASPKYPTGPHS